MKRPLLHGAKGNTSFAQLVLALLLLTLAPVNGATITVGVGTGGSDVFNPSSVQISVGDTIRWQWQDDGHNVVHVPSNSACTAASFTPIFCSSNPTTPSACSSISDGSNAGLDDFGNVYTFTFNTPGTYRYVCTKHCSSDGMRGTIVVLAGGTTAPPSSTAPSLTTPIPTSTLSTSAAPTTAPATFPGGTTAAPTTAPFINYTDPFDMTSLLPAYDNCHVYSYRSRGPAPDPVTPYAVLFWTVDTPNNRLDVGYNCYGGAQHINYCALGFKSDLTTSMLNSDVNIGFWDGSSASIIDYHIGSRRPNPLNPSLDVCNGNSPGAGVCRDIDIGCADDLAGTVGSVSYGGLKATFRWSRPLTSTDSACDVAISTNASVLVSARSVEAGLPVLQFHDLFFSAADAFSFLQPPDCPNNCSEVGTCVKGCCVCPLGTGGADCSLGTTVTPITLPALIPSGYYPFSHDFGKLSYSDDLMLYWITYQLTTPPFQNQTALELAIEFKHSNPANSWVAFGFGSEMRHSDVFVAQGPTLSELSDYQIGTGKRCCGAGTSIARDEDVGGQSNIITARSDYNATSGVWVIKYLRLLDTGDPLDKKLNMGWNNFIWAVGKENRLTSAGHGRKARWFGKFNLSTGQLKLALDQRIIHGAFMFVAMAVLVPAGATLARYGKLKLRQVWFHGHRIIMLVALGLELAGFITVAQFVKPGSQFRSAHSRLGIVIIIISLAQPFIGWATDITYNPNNTRPKPFPDLVHWILGWITIALVLVQCSLGLQLMVVSTAITVLWYLYLGLFVVASTAVAIYFFVRYRYYGFRGGVISVDDK